MKNLLILFSFFLLATPNFIYSQQSFIGKWSAVNSINEQFDFEFRSDGTCTIESYATLMKAEVNWKVEQKDIILYKVGSDILLKMISILISDKQWIFLMGDGVRYTCTRQKEPSLSQGVCWCCYDEGHYQCSACDGNGGKHVSYPYKVYNSSTGYYDTYYENKWIPCDNGDCDNGKVKCTCRKIHKKRN